MDSSQRSTAAPDAGDGMGRRPDFLFIGPDKSGSTWLFEVLRAHPQCYVADCKDLYFFDRYYERGLQWYLSFFRGAPAHAQAVGELSHDYLFSAAAAQRIASDLPQVKLITSLRNPVERTFSHYLYMLRSGRTRLPMEAALKAFPELLDNSHYRRHLEIYLRHFDARRIKILLFDDLRNHPRDFALDVFDFLGLTHDLDFDWQQRYRVASKPRSFALARLAKTGANLARDLGFPRLVGAIKHSPVTSWLYRPYSEQTRPRLAPGLQQELAQEFLDDVCWLEQFLGRDLSSWRENRED